MYRHNLDAFKQDKIKFFFLPGNCGRFAGKYGYPEQPIMIIYINIYQQSESIRKAK